MAQVAKRALISCCLLVTFALLVSGASSVVDTDTKPANADVNKDETPPVDTNTPQKNGSDVRKPSAALSNCTNSNGTECAEDDTNGGISSIFSNFIQNRDMLLRTMYVLFGVTLVVIVYFIVRALR